nr:hypothetical protein [Streptomyces aureoverticillatus]
MRAGEAPVCDALVAEPVEQRGVVVVGGSYEHAGPRAAVRVGNDAGVLQGLLGEFENESLLGVDEVRLRRGDPEESGVEALGLVEEPTPAARLFSALNTLARACLGVRARALGVVLALGIGVAEARSRSAGVGRTELSPARSSRHRASGLGAPGSWQAIR